MFSNRPGAESPSGSDVCTKSIPRPRPPSSSFQHHDAGRLNATLELHLPASSQFFRPAPGSLTAEDHDIVRRRDLCSANDEVCDPIATKLPSSPIPQPEDDHRGVASTPHFVLCDIWSSAFHDRSWRMRHGEQCLYQTSRLRRKLPFLVQL